MAGLTQQTTTTTTSEVKRIFDTMEYGPAPEAENVAKVSLIKFIVGLFCSIASKFF